MRNDLGTLFKRQNRKNASHVGAFVVRALSEPNTYEGKLMDTGGLVRFMGPVAGTLKANQPVLLARPDAARRVLNSIYIFAGLAPVHARSSVNETDEQTESVSSEVITSMPSYVTLIAGGDSVEVKIYGRNLSTPPVYGDAEIDDAVAQSITSSLITLNVEASLIATAGSYSLTVAGQTFPNFFRVREVRPQLGDYTWANQDSAYATQTNASSPIVMGMIGPVSSTGADEAHALLKPVTGPVTITLAITADMAVVDYHRVGLIVKGANNKYASVGLMTATGTAAGGPFLRVEKWNSGLGYTTQVYNGQATLSYVSGLIYFRFEDDGTNLKFYWSADGVTFTLLRSETRASDIGAPTHAGFFVFNQDTLPPREDVEMSVYTFNEQ